MTDDRELLRDLTPAQIEAVTHTDGPMLVVAGAGSGKTRVVTRRVARLIGRGVPPWRILALTFTNKAAREMRERVAKLTGEAPAWMGTFHSVCARILRRDIHHLADGRDNRFSILDQADQESLVKLAMKRLGIDDKTHRPAAVLAAIGRAKSDFVQPDEFAAASQRDLVAQEVYAEYEKDLRRNNALDFDDLLVRTALLFARRPEVLAFYRGRFPYILVDEYQDTNRAQYRLLRALAGDRANIHATGDPDQSIYSWRGADYRNIMDFQQDFPGARIVRLEENYRSRPPILAAANALIRHNTHRIEKDLVATRKDGDKVTVAVLQSDRMEAMWVGERMAALRKEGKRLGDMAVFYRTNAQSRALEEAMLREGIPYQLVGGVRFYERKEVKDLLAHLKLRVNPRDLPSLRRVVGCRPGVGAKTLERIVQAAEAADRPVFSLLSEPDFAVGFKATAKVRDFAGFCRRLAAVDTDRADVAVAEILALSGLVQAAMANADKDERADERVENLEGLVARAAEFIRLRLENAPPADPDGPEEEVPLAATVDLAAFLEDVALVADVDAWAGDADKATLMTLHSAKGLEFDDVFVTGLEEGLLPHRNCRDEAAVEEERRLFYVGVTRARERAWVTHAASRALHGTVDFSIPSRFLRELPPEAVTREDYGDSLSLEYGSGFGGRKNGWGTGKKNFGDFGADGDFFDIDADFDPDPHFQPEPDPGFPDAPAATPPPVVRRPAAPKPRASGGRSRFKPGDLVKHPAFGSGKVLTADKGKIMVQFFSSGTRLLVEALAQLTRE